MSRRDRFGFVDWDVVDADADEDEDNEKLDFMLKDLIREGMNGNVPLKLEEMYRFLQKKPFDPDLPRRYALANFLTEFIRVMQATYTNSGECNKIWSKRAVDVLGVCIERGSFTPSEICESEIFSLIEPLLQSDDSCDEQIVASFFSSCLVKGDVPIKVLESFFGIATGCLDAYQLLSCRLECLIFLEKVLEYTEEVPEDALLAINECVRQVLKRSKNSQLYRKALVIIRLELMRFPEQYVKMRDIFEIVCLILKSADAKLLIGVLRVLSQLCLIDEFPVEELLNQTSVETIVSSINSIEQNVSECALQLIVDMCSRGELLIDRLLDCDLLQHIVSEYDRVAIQKQLVFVIYRKIFFYGNAESCAVLLSDSRTSCVCREVFNFGGNSALKFFRSVKKAFNKAILLDPTLDLWSLLPELRDICAESQIMRESKKTGDIEALENINRQQKLLIQILSTAYNAKTDKGRIYEIIRQYFVLHDNIQSMSRDIQEISGKMSISFDQEGQERVRELEREIQLQDEAYEKLEEQLRQYNEQAKEYEDLLAENEKAKAKLLDSFRKQANTSQLEGQELEEKTEKLNEECERLRKQSDDARKLCNEVRDELKKSKEECKSLERQVAAAKEQLSGTMSSLSESGIKKRISQQESVIEQLEKEYEAATQQMAKLKRENEELRLKLVDSD